MNAPFSSSDTSHDPHLPTQRYLHRFLCHSYHVLLFEQLLHFPVSCLDFFTVKCSSFYQAIIPWIFCISTLFTFGIISLAWLSSLLHPDCVVCIGQPADQFHVTQPASTFSQFSFMSSFEPPTLLKLISSVLSFFFTSTHLNLSILFTGCKFCIFKLQIYLHWFESKLRSSQYCPLSMPYRSVEERANKEMFQSFVCTADSFHSCALASLSHSPTLFLSLSPSLSLVPRGAQLGEADKQTGAQGLAPTLLSQCYALLFKGPSQKWEGLNPAWKSQGEEAAAGGREREMFIWGCLW